MTENLRADANAGRKVWFMPADACDSHCHLFGPADRFPYAEDAPYTPADAGLDRYQALQRRLCLSRAVFVQPACHGQDHSALLDALAQGGGRYRGVALMRSLPPPSHLTALDRAGVRSVRFNFLPHLGGDLDFSGCQAIASVVERLGWHVTLHLTPDALIALAPQIETLTCRVVIDHFGRIDAGRGLAQAAFQTLLRLMTHEHAWVKISAADRASATGPPYDDVVPFAQALIDVAPDRVLWGTDWPHPNVRRIPDDRDLVELLDRFAPSEAQRTRILVGNPAALYGFSDPVPPTLPAGA